MASTFWTNTVWYLALLAVGAAVLAAAFIKSPDRRLTLALLFAVLGFSYFLELQLLLIFNAYTYYPKIVSDAFQDAVLGNHFSQISINAASVFIAVLGLKKRWHFIFAFVFFLIEILFAGLGIYQLYWYRHIYTFAAFIAYSWVVRVWYNKSLHAPKKWLNYLTLFFGVFGGGGVALYLPLKVFWIQYFKANFFDDISKNHYGAFFIYATAIIILIIIIYKSKLSWAKRGIAFIFLFSCIYFLWLTGVLFIRPGWFVPAALLDIFSYYFWTVLLSRCLKPPLRISSASQGSWLPGK